MKIIKNKNIKKIKAFTLIELIVVITILAILGTIAFISFRGYSLKSRNSVRITDVKSIEKSLELSSLQTGNYPKPNGTEGVDIFTRSFSGADLWVEGKFNQDILNQTGNLDKVPLDPENKTEYDYSKALNQNEYQIKYSLEEESSEINSVYADSGDIIKLGGSYNGIYVIGNDKAFYSSPSLFSNDIATSFYIDEQKDLLDFTITQLATKKPTENDIIDNYTTFGDNIKSAYNTDNFRDLPIYSEILDINDSAYLGEVVLKSGILSGGSGDGTKAEAYSCTGSLIKSNAIIENYTGLTEDKEYQNIDDTSECYYECKDNYSGTNCETYSMITPDQCTGAGWIWIDKANDVKIGTQEKTGYCISPRIGDFPGDGSGNGISWNGWGNDPNDLSYKGWDSSAVLNGETVDDDGNPSPLLGQTKNLTHVNDIPILYTCSSLGEASGGYIGEDTIVGRMKWLADENNKNNLTAMQNIPWVEKLNLNNGHPTPAIYIADCIDGIKDLGTDMTYIHKDNSIEEVTYDEYNTDESDSTFTISLTNTIYQNREKYLTAWTQKSGSHLPSAFSYIENGTAGGELQSGSTTNWDLYEDDNAKGEYQMACELLQDNENVTNNDFYYSTPDQSSDQSDGEWIWLSAIGDVDGIAWGRVVRVVGGNGCSDESHGSTGNRDGSLAARFVIRP